MNNNLKLFSVNSIVSNTMINNRKYKYNINQYVMFLRSKNKTFKRSLNRIEFERMILVFSNDDYVKIFMPYYTTQIVPDIKYTNPLHFHKKLLEYKKLLQKFQLKTI